MPDSAEHLDNTSTTVAEATIAVDNQLNEGSKRPRRVLKTHRKSVDESKASSSFPPKKTENINTIDDFDESITTESLKDILNVTQSSTENDDTGRPNNNQDYDGASQKGEDAETDEEIDSAQIRTIPPSQHEPTSTLHVKNFVRPLTIPMVRNLLEQFGRIEYFWMDKIKSHCYVKFEKLESAILARESLWHTIFPPETGRPLELEFLTFEQAQGLIVEAEEKSAKSGHGASREARDKRLNGNNNLGNAAAIQFPIPAPPSQPTSNVKVISLDTLFSKTSTKPTLYYKTVSQEDAKAKMKILERSRGRRRS
ncbi:8228_t:CDS:2 [Funneliformis mosseae]|uniref:8228_t:CDS:1 n=1 Tax=Funneliformis mosseae TaxID=27381 RepID=A0A9N9CNL3_FUNMO|nr:8228_t:CDS:2 [Funneliformis mosseae]